MKLISSFILAITLTVIYSGCTNRSNEKEQLQIENARLKHEADSLRSLIVRIDTARIEQQISPDVTPSKTDLAGKHGFTLQWISWDFPGSVMIRPSTDGWYTIEGGQKSGDNNDHITIKGRIKALSPFELLFEGEIISVVAANNKGEPCIKTGQQTFRATGNREYWRMQDMINCEGGMLTDYVDIYF